MELEASTSTPNVENEEIKDEVEQEEHHEPQPEYSLFRDRQRRTHTTPVKFGNEIWWLLLSVYLKMFR